VGINLVLDVLLSALVTRLTSTIRLTDSVAVLCALDAIAAVLLSAATLILLLLSLDRIKKLTG